MITDTNPNKFSSSRIVNVGAILVIVWLVGYLLYTGRSLLIPFVMAVFIWHLLNTINNGMRKIPWLGERLPFWLWRLLSLATVAILVKILIDIISNNVNEVIQTFPRYQENLTHILTNLDKHLKIKTLANFDTLFKSFNLQSVVINTYAVFTTITSSAVLIALYVAFLFVEQHYFKQKINALFPQPGHRLLVDNIINHIVRDTQTYLGIKTLLGLVTATSSWVIMKIMGLDFAEFWALLIFFLNFIPNIGAIIATAFPAVLALIQFDSLLPFIVISSVITGIQFIVGNLLEPKFLGKSLNVSTLVILLALAFWGSIWGVLGMFLSVPITVMMMIIFAHFDRTRPIAILLSQDGYIKKAYETLA